MKKKICIVLIVLFIIFFVSIFCPVKIGQKWVNYDEIADVGGTIKVYYNIYGGDITEFVMLIKH